MIPLFPNTSESLVFTYSSTGIGGVGFDRALEVLRYYASPSSPIRAPWWRKFRHVSRSDTFVGLRVESLQLREMHTRHQWTCG